MTPSIKCSWGSKQGVLVNFEYALKLFMSFLRSLLSSGAGATGESAVEALVDGIMNGDEKCVGRLRDVAKKQMKDIGEPAIHALMHVLDTGAADEVVSDVYAVLNKLLRPSCEERSENAALILKEK